MNRKIFTHIKKRTARAACGLLRLALILPFVFTATAAAGAFEKAETFASYLATADEQIPEYAVENGDVLFIPGYVAAGTQTEAYIVKSGTMTTGTKVLVSFDSVSGSTLDRFWEKKNGSTGSVGGIWHDATPYVYGYHDTVTAVTDTSLTIAHAPEHRGSCPVLGASCGNATTATRYYECAGTLDIAKDLAIIDLRADVLAGTADRADSLNRVKALCDAGLAMVNTYAGDGACSTEYNNSNNATGTASAIVVLDFKTTGTLNAPAASYPVTVSESIPGGTVSTDIAAGSAGSTVTVTAQPRTGYKLVSILVDGEPIPSNTFTIRGLHTVSAEFRADAQDGDVLYIPDGVKAAGGVAEGYYLSNPTVKAEIPYVGYKNSAAEGLFYTVTYDAAKDGIVLEGQYLWVDSAVAGYHNYFAGYDSVNQVLYLADGTAADGHGSSACGFTCYVSSAGMHELPMTVAGVTASTPVLDTTGNGIESVEDILALYTQGKRVRISHYSADGGTTPPAALYVDEVVQTDVLPYVACAGDVFFVPGNAYGTEVEGYVLNSETVASDMRVEIRLAAEIPDGTTDAGSWYGRQNSNNFWVIPEADAAPACYTGAWDDEAAFQYKVAYHDTITAIAQDGTAMTIANAAGHAGSPCQISGGFPYRCGDATSRCYELAAEVSVADEFAVIDLREGETEPVATLSALKALVRTSTVLVNLYGEGVDTVSAVILMDAEPKTAHRITVSDVQGGTVTADLLVVYPGDTVTVTATAEQGYVLDAILVDGVAQTLDGNKAVFVVDGDHTITAVFSLPSYTLQEGDVVFVPGNAHGGKAEGYIVASQTMPVGTRVIPVLTGTWNNDSYCAGRFWENVDGEIVRVHGVLNNETQAYTYGWHEDCVDVLDGYIKTVPAIGHADSGCGFGHAELCDYGLLTDDYECYGLTDGALERTIPLAETVTVLDLRSTDSPVTDLEGLDVLAEDSDLVVNIYCAEPNTASVILILKSTPGISVSPENAVIEMESSLGLKLFVANAVPEYTYTVARADRIIASGTLALDETSQSYWLACQDIAAKEMRDRLTVRIYDRDSILRITQEFSLYDIALGWYETQPEGSALKTLIADMLNYGAAAQREFGYNTDVLAEESLITGSAEVPVWTAADGAGTDRAENAAKVAYTVSLADRIVLNVYIDDAAAGVSGVTFRDEAYDKYTVTTVTGGEKQVTRISFADINAAQAKEAVSFTVTLSDSSTFDITYSIRDYVAAAVGGRQTAVLQALQKYVESAISCLEAGA